VCRAFAAGNTPFSERFFYEVILTNKPAWAAAIRNAVIPLDRVKPHPDNYNEHPDKQLSQLGASLTEFSQYRSAVLWERPGGEYIQVAGHGVIEALRRNDETEGRFDILPIETPESVVRRILVADNRHGQNSISNEELLAELLQAEVDAGNDLDALGTDEEELSQMLARMAAEYAEAEEAEEDEDGAPDGEVPFVNAPDLPYKNQFAVAVSCESEAHQKEVYDKLVAQGYTCKVLVV
jgi:hypothetical protein